VITCGLLSKEQSERDQPWLTHGWRAIGA